MTTLTTPVETVAHIEAAGHEDHGPTVLGLGAEGWVYTGVTIFFVLAFVVAKAHRKILGGLDAQIAETRRELDEAAALRAEAEAILADAHKKRSSAETDAKAMVAAAEADAAILVADAEEGAMQLIARRAQAAEDRIAAAERAAVADVRSKAATVSANAAKLLIAQHHDAKADASLIEETIAKLN